jgi:mycothiol system anti-sigma-R factor
VSPVSCGEHHKTDCREVLAEVYLYLDLECDKDRQSLIRDHLDECSPCLHEFGIEVEVKALVARCCGDETAPVELRERLRAKLSELVVDVETREYLPD